MFRFPWGDFHSLNLGWFLQKFNELREDWATAEAGIDGALDAEIQKAEDALTDVFAARDAAAASARAANSSASNASQSSLASMDARDQSRAARDAAQQAAGNAAASETAAGQSATAAGQSATAAGQSATAAGQSAAAAAASETAAGNSATAAAASETAAGNSATAAAASETAAGQSAEDAETAASRVEDSTQQIATNASDINTLKKTVIDLNEFGAQYSFIPNRVITLTGITITLESDGSYHYVGTAKSAINIEQGRFHCVAGKTYRYHLNTDYDNLESQSVYFYIRNVNNGANWIRSKDYTFTATSDHDVIFVFYAANGANVDITIKPYYTTQPTNAELSNKELITNKILETMIANSPLVVNDIVIVGNNLYRVITNIASGASLTVGTNVVSTTIADILKTLLN